MENNDENDISHSRSPWNDTWKEIDDVYTIVLLSSAKLLRKIYEGFEDFLLFGFQWSKTAVKIL